MATGAEVEKIVNEALPEGIPHINWIYEGSRAARVALRVYRQTRREILRGADWPFARRSVALTLLKGPPPPGGYTVTQPWSSTYPPPDVLFEYAYPADAIEIKTVERPGLIFDLDPSFIPFRIDNDNTLNPPAKVILCDIRGAVATYVGDVTDPLQWEAGFRATMIGALAKKLGEKLAGANAQDRQEMAGETREAGMMADTQRG